MSIPDYILRNDGLDDLLTFNAEFDPRCDEISNDVVREIVRDCCMTYWITELAAVPETYA
jgi:hypothetical protein